MRTAWTSPATSSFTEPLSTPAPTTASPWPSPSPLCAPRETPRSMVPKPPRSPSRSSSSTSTRSASARHNQTLLHTALARLCAGRIGVEQVFERRNHTLGGYLVELIVLGNRVAILPTQNPDIRNLQWKPLERLLPRRPQHHHGSHCRTADMHGPRIKRHHHIAHRKHSGKLRHTGLSRNRGPDPSNCQPNRVDGRSVTRCSNINDSA